MTSLDLVFLQKRAIPTLPYHKSCSPGHGPTHLWVAPAPVRSGGGLDWVSWSELGQKRPAAG